MDFTRRIDNGRTVVEALDPKLIAEVPGNPDLAPIAEEAGQRIQTALDYSETPDVLVAVQ